MICFLTFSNSLYAKARKRIVHEASALRKFDKIISLDEGDLDESYLDKYGGFIKSNPRGFGYWIWKPYVINKTLSELSEGDILVYADSGCAINYKNRSKFDKYINLTMNSKLGILCFSNGFIEKQWDKGDLIEFMECRNRSDILDSMQIMAGIIVVEKNADSLMFINNWCSYVHDNLDLLDDSPSRAKNEDGFVENRHDQSFFSLLLKKTGGFVVLPHSEVEVPAHLRSLGWKTYWLFRKNVFLAIRDKNGIIYDERIVPTMIRDINCIFEESIRRISNCAHLRKNNVL